MSDLDSLAQTALKAWFATGGERYPMKSMEAAIQSILFEKTIVYAPWPKPSAWQPIETAPKDGSAVLCNAAGWDRPRWLLWLEDVKPPAWGSWRDAEATSFDIFHPTHWLPIPELPE